MFFVKSVFKGSLPKGSKATREEREMKKWNSGWLICISFALLLALGASTRVTPKHKGNCTYAITIETTCTKGAETSNHVNLRFGDTNSNDIIVHHLNTKHMRRLDPLEPQSLDEVPKKPFEACTVDQFQYSGQCVKSPVCYLYLKVMGYDDWRPGFAQVRVVDGGDHLNSEYFYFRRYLPRNVWHGIDNCDTEVTPFGVKYKRKVFGKKMPDDSVLS